MSYFSFTKIIGNLFPGRETPSLPELHLDQKNTSFPSQRIITKYVLGISTVCLSDKKKASVDEEKTTKQKWWGMDRQEAVMLGVAGKEKRFAFQMGKHQRFQEGADVIWVFFNITLAVIYRICFKGTWS